MRKFEELDIASIYNISLKYMLAISLILFCVFHENISYALGFLLGGVACLLNFRIMTRSVEGMLGKRTYSKAFFNGYFLLRIGVVSAVLVSAIMLESVNLVTAVAGILIIRVIVAWEAFLLNNKSKKVWSD